MKLSKFKPKNFYFKKIKYSAGRNNLGIITVHHRAAGPRRFIRQINWRRDFFEAIVFNYDYSSTNFSRLACLSTFKSLKNKNLYFYILLPKGLKIFDKIETFFSSIKKGLPKIGDASVLANFDIGDFLHNIEFYPHSKTFVSCSAGVYSQILHYKNSIFRRLRLPSGHQRLFYKKSLGTFGVLENQNHYKKKFRSAGEKRVLGKRPHVRGVAMNPVDHPHGGGQGKTKGGRPSVTPSSWPTKGQPTRRKKKKVLILQEKNV